MIIVKVGQTVEFDPMAHLIGFGAIGYKGNLVKGTIVMVNYKNGWFSVEYGNPKARTSFNFADVGDGVTILG